MGEVSEPQGTTETKRSPLRRLYDWTVGWADRPGGSWALFLIAFVESSFFIIPPDVLLLALCVGAPKKSFKFAAISTAGSVLGGVIGYTIGMFMWGALRDVFIPLIFSEELFLTVRDLYQDNAVIAILSAAFTPIPYKVFTIAAGVFEVSLIVLVVASILGRGARFFLVGGLIYLFGPTIKTWIERYFDLFAWAALILGILGFLALKLLH